VERSIENAICFGAYDGERQIGFARVVTDRATFAYIGDVFVLPPHRGRGVSKQIMQAIREHPDLQNLRRKVDAGLDFVITQLFFDNRHYWEFVERARAAGITAPIIPGIMPITNAAQVERFTISCGAALPFKLAAELDRRRNDAQAVMQLGVAHATSQAIDLLTGGAPGVHFYTLNRSTATRDIFSALKVMGLVGAEDSARTPIPA